MGKNSKKSKRKSKFLHRNDARNSFVKISVSDSKALEKFNQELYEGFDDLNLEIDRLVIEIANFICLFDPLDILKTSFRNFVVKHARITSEIQIGREQSLSLRMIDYVQSVICSASYNSDLLFSNLNEQDWEKIKDLVDSLYNLLQLPYFLGASARRRTHYGHDEDIEKILVHTQMHWLMVRSERYYSHEIPRLRDLLTPHDEIFRSLFNVSVSEIIEGFSQLQRSLSHGISEALEQAQSIHSAFKEFLDAEHASLIGSGQGVPKKLFDEFLDLTELRVTWRQALAKIDGDDLFDVKLNTGLPDVLLDKLSWTLGEDKNFFAAGEHAGWPLRQLPIHKRPFLKYKERYYCFDQVSLFDGLYRKFQWIVGSLKPDYKQKWNELQKTVTEDLVIRLFTKILPLAKTFSAVYYEYDDPITGKRNWTETDGIVDFAGHLFVLEAKAGLYSNLSPFAEFDSHKSSMSRLLEAPLTQGQRFLTEFHRAGTITLHDKNFTPLVTLYVKDFHFTTAIALTLDSVAAVSTRIADLAAIGIKIPSHSVWCMSLDDLQVYADIFTSPVRFLHFVEQRLKAEKNPQLRPDDEIDYLGMYFERNIDAGEIEEIDSRASVTWAGFRSAVDKFYHWMLVDSSRALRPEQLRFEPFDSVVDLLEKENVSVTYSAASYLLDLSFEDRKLISDFIVDSFERIQKSERLMPISLGGSKPVTILCVPENIDPQLGLGFLHHAKTDMKLRTENQRLFLIVTFVSPNTPKKIFYYKLIMSNDIQENTVSDDDVRKLREGRVAQARSKLPRGRIGVNAFCPCGSGKKFKRCCLLKKAV